MRARVDGELALWNLQPPVLERLRLELRLENQKFQQMKRMKFSTDGIPEYIDCLLEYPDGSVHVPRGSIALVRDLLNRRNVPLGNIEDARTRGQPVQVQRGPIPQWREYQLKGIEIANAALQGLILLPPGTGKSWLGIGAILARPCTTLILAPTIDIIEQWLADLARAGLSCGKLGDGSFDSYKDVVVATPESAAIQIERDELWAGRFGRVIVDEAHHCPVDLYQKLLRQLPAIYRLGLTATREREDGFTRLVDWSFGSILLERSVQEMVKLGYLMPATIEIIETGWTWEYDGPPRKKLARMEKGLAEDESRNLLIAKRIAGEAKKGETCLLLVRERAHAKTLAALISAHGARAEAVTGSTGKKQRRNVLQELRDGKLDVAVATSLANEGLDIPRLSVVGLATPMRSEGATLQKIGRALRKFPGKKPKILDWVDENVDTLVRRAQARKRIYKEAGLTAA